METFLLIASIYLLYGIPVVAGGLCVWFLLRKRIHLFASDWLLVIAPFAVWLIATSVYDGEKTLSNLVEAIFLGGITLLLFTARAVLTTVGYSREVRLSSAALAGSCVAAVALWGFVPGLPE